MQIVFRRRHNNLFAWDVQPMETRTVKTWLCWSIFATPCHGPRCLTQMFVALPWHLFTSPPHSAQDMLCIECIAGAKNTIQLCIASIARREEHNCASPRQPDFERGREPFTALALCKCAQGSRRRAQNLCAILQMIALLCTNMQSGQDCTAAALEEVWTLSGRLIGFGNLLLLSWPNFRDTWRKFRGAHPLPAKTIKEPAMKEGVYEEIYKTPYYWLQWRHLPVSRCVPLLVLEWSYKRALVDNILIHAEVFLSGSQTRAWLNSLQCEMCGSVSACMTAPCGTMGNNLTHRDNPLCTHSRCTHNTIAQNSHDAKHIMFIMWYPLSSETTH